MTTLNTLVEQLHQYCNLSDEAFKALYSVLKKVELPKGSLLIEEGKICDHVYFLEKGCARGYYNLDGKEISYWFAFENNFVTSFFSFISRKQGLENIQLLEDSILWSLSYEELQKLYLSFPEIERLGRIMIEHYYVMLEERFVNNHFKESRERYENLIARSPHILHRVPLGYVATYLGVTQETLSRIRNKP
jgi:CRP-like cAMP-binding protein